MLKTQKHKRYYEKKKEEVSRKNLERYHQKKKQEQLSAQKHYQANSIKSYYLLKNTLK
jgi:hypothetical protein